MKERTKKFKVMAHYGIWFCTEKEIEEIEDEFEEVFSLKVNHRIIIGQRTYIRIRD
jgi:hypothetical protein